MFQAVLGSVGCYLLLCIIESAGDTYGFFTLSIIVEHFIYQHMHLESTLIPLGEHIASYN